MLKPANGLPANWGNGVTVSFVAPSRAAVAKFHKEALALGAKDEGARRPTQLASHGVRGLPARSRRQQDLRLLFSSGVTAHSLELGSVVDRAELQSHQGKVHDVLRRNSTRRRNRVPLRLTNQRRSRSGAHVSQDAPVRPARRTHHRRADGRQSRVVASGAVGAAHRLSIRCARQDAVERQDHVRRRDRRRRSRAQRVRARLRRRCIASVSTST